MSYLPLIPSDPFTDKPISGNPAAGCVLEKEATADWMQAVASEMNLLETAFVKRTVDSCELRCFTRTIEVELCGHGIRSTKRTVAGWLAADGAVVFGMGEKPAVGQVACEIGIGWQGGQFREQIAQAGGASVRPGYCRSPARRSHSSM